MSFIRTKTIKGKVYRYEVEGYRDPITGKVRQRTRYLGKESAASPQPSPQKLGTTTPAPGDGVQLTLTLRGEPARIEGIVAPGMTQVAACRYPKEGGKVGHKTVSAVYTPPDTIAVLPEHEDLQPMQIPYPAPIGMDLSILPAPMASKFCGKCGHLAKGCELYGHYQAIGWTKVICRCKESIPPH